MLRLERNWGGNKVLCKVLCILPCDALHCLEIVNGQTLALCVKRTMCIYDSLSEYPVEMLYICLQTVRLEHSLKGRIKDGNCSLLNRRCSQIEGVFF
jgi:hypothetical protein